MQLTRNVYSLFTIAHSLKMWFSLQRISQENPYYYKSAHQKLTKITEVLIFGIPVVSIIVK